MAETTTVSIPDSAFSYPIHIGYGLLSQADKLLSQVLPGLERVLIVTDETVNQLFLKPLEAILTQSSLAVMSVQIKADEAHKTLDTLNILYETAYQHALKRTDAVIALGGGIVGDISGLLAATYLRGLPFVQIPTTLLAQVDASVGGKVAVNYQQFKNMIGTFYHPKLVLIDIDTLKTLPSREFNCGMAEVIKYALIEKSVPGENNKAALFQTLMHSDNILEIITRCCELKAVVVSADPEERLGIREILNLGHTFAHAYETLSSGEIPHGEAVAIGCVKAFETACALGQISEEEVTQVRLCFEKYQLPVTLSQRFLAQDVLACMQRDKKMKHEGQLRLVLPYGNIGQVRVQEKVDSEIVKSVL